MRSSRVWMRSSRVWMRSSPVWMRPNRVWMRSSQMWTRSSRAWMKSSWVWTRSSREWMRSSRVWMRYSRVWMRSSRVVRASGRQVSMPKSQQSWVRSQHPPTQWNLRGGRWRGGVNNVHKNKNTKKIHFMCLFLFRTTDAGRTRGVLTGCWGTAACARRDSRGSSAPQRSTSARACWSPAPTAAHASTE